MVDADATKSELEQAQAQAQEMGQPDDRISRIDSVQVGNVDKPQGDGIYAEALAQYPTDDSIDPILEKKVRRKLDRLIIPVLGVCYFFYYVDKTTLSYAAIFGLKDDLKLRGDEYSWLSSSFYFGWLIWAIPSNLLMQRSPPGYYLAFNIFMWGALLMTQAAAKNFAGLLALRILSGAFEAIADPAFMLVTSMYFTREEQPSRISAWYAFNGIGVAGGANISLTGYAIGNIKGALQPWRYEFLVVGAFCSAWAIALVLLLPNSPRTIRGFSHDEKLIMIARMRRNQTGIEQRRINWGQIKEAYLDYKTWLFTLLGFVSNVPNGGISNFSTLVIQGLGFDTLHTALLGIPQGALVVIWIGLGALANKYMPPNSRTLVSAIFMIPTIAGALGFLLAPEDAYVGRLICFYLTGSYQASFVICLSLITSNTGGQSKKMIVSGMIWFGACVGNIASPFFYRPEQAPSYHLGIGSLLVANCIEFALFFVFRYAFKWENKRKEQHREALRAAGHDFTANTTAFMDMTDKENPNFEYVLCVPTWSTFTRAQLCRYYDRCLRGGRRNLGRLCRGSFLEYLAVLPTQTLKVSILSPATLKRHCLQALSVSKPLKMAPIQVVEHKELKSCSGDFVYGDPKGSYLAAIILAVTLTLMTAISISLCLVASQQKGKLKELHSSTKESTKHVQIVPPTDWQKPGNSPLRHVEPVSPVSSTASSEYEGFSESAPPSDGYYGSNDQSFTARTERMVAEVRTEQDGSNRVSDKPPQIPRYPFQGSGQ
ncbi:major facilitator superfamily domain-containing protein [Fusarium oxysporum Fo47]|uniref:major facilitator superfamily domain-containing protein n=1 Tax=Fusarium oxysporum Fo47 TaxID=660027 RepID=UPI002869B239|nr:major facilitator superfamily domain-containing protein [Fusarium oxysporum Fo47]WJG34462.1 major facilitator superfamily domain-containing protein [Fusarium oxysporum Fo47]